jgi:hypothetical protein
MSAFGMTPSSAERALGGRGRTAATSPLMPGTYRRRSTSSGSTPTASGVSLSYASGAARTDHCCDHRADPGLLNRRIGIPRAAANARTSAWNRSPIFANSAGQGDLTPQLPVQGTGRPDRRPASGCTRSGTADRRIGSRAPRDPRASRWCSPRTASLDGEGRGPALPAWPPGPRRVEAGRGALTPSR